MLKKTENIDLLEILLRNYLECGYYIDQEIIEKYDAEGILLGKSKKIRKREIEVSELLKIYELLTKIKENKLNELLLGLR